MIIGVPERLSSYPMVFVPNLRTARAYEVLIYRSVSDLPNDSKLDHRQQHVPPAFQFAYIKTIGDSPHNCIGSPGHCMIITVGYKHPSHGSILVFSFLKYSEVN
jgi:hypothetical protein